MKNLSVVQRTPSPWIDDSILEMKRKRGQAERTWKKSRLCILYDNCKHLCNSVKICVENAKANYYNSKITNCHGNQQALFNIVNSLLGKDDKPHAQVPLSTEDLSIAEKLNDYFVSNIVKIRDLLSQLSTSTSALTCPPVNSLIKCANRKLNTSEPGSSDEVSKIVMKASKATCNLDPVPTIFFIFFLGPCLC